ncbi:MAG: family 10 glycosylhydrolase [Pseudoflavonifractor sp.]|nr:family 10 glycosylhydrolase [Pseudoflavonifractor sp.]
MRVFPVIALIVVSALSSHGATHPKYETRAAWITTDGGRDWPRGLYGEAEQKKALTDLLDQLDNANFNTVYIQLQCRGGVAWTSSYYPTMSMLTGDGAKTAGYDVMEFVIDECHRRHMECHAWLTPFNQGYTADVNRYALNKVGHISSTHPGLCVTFNGTVYLDPGIPEARGLIVASYRELLSRYRLDGINLDAGCYSGSLFADDDSYYEHNPYYLSKEEWRRANMTDFIAEFADMVSEVSPDTRIGVTTLGVYKPIFGYDSQSTYNHTYQNPGLWIDNRYIDYLSPRMFHGESEGFSRNLAAWIERMPDAVVAGLSVERLANQDVTPTDITGQIESIRDTDRALGIALYGMSSLFGNGEEESDLRDLLRDDYFLYPSHIHPKNDLYDYAPNPPINVNAEHTGSGYLITWDPPFPSPEGTPVRYYSIYLSDGRGVDISDSNYVVCAKTDGHEFFYPSPTDNGLQFAITAFDTYYRESEPSITKTGVETLDIPEYFYYHQGSLMISGAKTIDRVEIYTFSGPKVSSHKIGDRQATVDCSNTASGVYVARVMYTDGSSKVGKFIK